MKDNRMVARIAWILAFFLVSLSVQAADEAITPQDIAKMKTVSQAEMSPSGEHVAVVMSVPRNIGKDEDGRAYRELHVLDVKTQKLRPYITGKVNVSSVSWTPDGSGIAFVAKRGDDKKSALYIIPLDGGEARCALRLPGGVGEYSFNPEGTHVAALASTQADKKTKKLKEMGFSQSVVEEDWLPTKVLIAKLFSDEEPRQLPLPSNAMGVAWSPAGDRLAVSLTQNPLVDARYTQQEIHIVKVADGTITHKIDHQGKLGKFIWRPDGGMVSFIGVSDKNDPATGRLWMFDLKSGSLKDGLNNHKGQVQAMAWQSSKYLMFIDNNGVWTRFAKIGADGSGFKEIVTTGGPILTSMSLSKDGQNAAFVAQSPQHPSEVYLMSHGDKEPRRVTDSNPWLNHRQLAPQEVVRFKARDGLELEGILIRPLHAKKGQRVPLILYVHGGPEAHHKNGWLTGYSVPGQMAAARGMAVFYTNYRGSTGRGVEFSKLSQGRASKEEFDDLVDAVDHLIEMGLVDKNKVGVTGGSYGGYATAWCSTYYSDRFAAGVMFVGITNTISKVGTTDIPEEEFLVHALKRPWDDWQGYLESSPIYHADKHRTPLLILHGEDDPRVNVGQSRELYRHLQVRNQAPVRFVTYPGEGHGNRRAASRFDYNLRQLRWLEYYLKGPGGDPPDFVLDYGIED